jgi:NAD(P)-dependent dehydrogenase (short-subunit alcohol dehydrogenase family)
MGEALATYYISKGWLVACLDLQRSAGEALASSLGPNAHFWEANVADYDSQARVFQAVFDKWGRIDALLANAGIVDKSSIYILNYRDSDVYVLKLSIKNERKNANII